MTNINGVRIISIFLPLSRMDQSACLDFCLLSCAGSPTSNTRWISSTILRLRIEVLSCSRKRWQNIFIVIFERFVYFRHSWISSLRLKMMNYTIISTSSRSLTSKISICLSNGLLMLLDMRAISSTCIRNHSFFVHLLFHSPKNHTRRIRIIHLKNNIWTKSVFLSVLFLGCKNSFVEELSLLSRVKSVASDLIARRYCTSSVV